MNLTVPRLYLQYQDYIFLSKTYEDMNILPMFIFKKTDKIFIPP